MSEETEALEPTVVKRTAVPIGRAIVILLVAFVVGALFFNLVEPVLRFILDHFPPVGKVDKDSPVPGLAFSRVAGSVFGFIVGAGIGNLISTYIEKLSTRWDNLTNGGKVTMFLGVFIGLVASVPFLFFLFTLLSNQIGLLLGAMVILIGGFTFISIHVLYSIKDILPWNHTEAIRQRTGIKILDTSVIIDGRIVDVARAGFLEGELYVAGFVLDELQYIADSHDAMRRLRGRRGLDVLHLLQADFELEVRIHDRLAPDIGDEVDARLVRLARAIGGDIVTNDHNLNRVAALQDVRVLNINELALALRPNILPSENLEISVTREGNQPGQGVGYLDDGTMVVIENGRTHLGETINVIVSQVIQTERGKMLFAYPDGEGADALVRRRPPTNRRT